MKLRPRTYSYYSITNQLDPIVRTLKKPFLLLKLSKMWVVVVERGNYTTLYLITSLVSDLVVKKISFVVCVYTTGWY